MAEQDKYVIQTINTIGIKSFIMPSGFSSNVQIYCWGAGGGKGRGSLGGGGGFASTIATVQPGDEISLQIGQPGGNGSYPNGGAGGTDPSYTAFSGGSAGNVSDEDADTGAGGGGGGASWVTVNNSVVCCGAGGGGGGGYGDDGSGGNPGLPGGSWIPQPTSIYAVTNGAWGSFMNSYAVWYGSTGGTHSFSKVLNFPISGNYTFTVSSDNDALWNIDSTGTTYATPFEAFRSSYSQTLFITAGNHTLNVTVNNPGSVGGMAARITKPDTTEFWNSRDLLSSPGLTSNFRGGNSTNGGSSGGGGGGGYPYGGAGGFTNGDDAGDAGAGSGGQNYGTITETGSGSLPGGRTNKYYPGERRGESGYPGYILLILEKQFNVLIKGAGGGNAWVNTTAAYVKVAEQTLPISISIGPTTARYNNDGFYTFTVPDFCTSIAVSVTGAGGGGGGGGFGTGGETSGSGSGGGSGYTSTGTISVTPKEVLTVQVGRGGAGGPPHYSRDGGGGGGAGGASLLKRGASTLLTAAGGNGGTGGREGLNVAGGTGFRNGGNGAAAAGAIRAGGNGGASTLAPGAVGIASGGGGGGFAGITPAPSGTLGAGGAGGGASDSVGSGPGGDQGAPGGAGGDGVITITYSVSGTAITTYPEGWKQIQQAFVKVSATEWKAIAASSKITLNGYPIKNLPFFPT